MPRVSAIRNTTTPIDIGAGRSLASFGVTFPAVDATNIGVVRIEASYDRGNTWKVESSFVSKGDAAPKRTPTNNNFVTGALSLDRRDVMLRASFESDKNQIIELGAA